MYLVTMKHYHMETPLGLFNDIEQAKSAKYDFKISWSDLCPIHLYEINMKEINKKEE